MGAMRKVPRPVLYPGRTVWGSVGGPVVHVGYVIPPASEADAGVSVFLDERESRELVHAWGWATPEQHQALLDQAEVISQECKLLRRRVVELEAELEPLRTLAQTLQQLRETGFAFPPPRPNDAIIVVRSCSATKVDGTPCTARAVPGRDVCIAHSKTKTAA